MEKINFLKIGFSTKWRTKNNVVTGKCGNESRKDFWKMREITAFLYAHGNVPTERESWMMFPCCCRAGLAALGEEFQPPLSSLCWSRVLSTLAESWPTGFPLHLCLKGLQNNSLKTSPHTLSRSCFHKAPDPTLGVGSDPGVTTVPWGALCHVPNADD